MTGARWTVLRVLFPLAVGAGAWWSWRDSGDQLVDALGEVDAWHVASAIALVVSGLLLTGTVWWLALRSFDVDGSAPAIVPQFFVAQLGKYIPGSVWLFAAQGALGARHGIPSRVAASASVLFLGVHVASGLLLAGALVPASLLAGTAVTFAPVLAIVGAVGLLPIVHRTLGGRLAGRPCRWRWRRSILCSAVMVPAWGFYALALSVLVPDPTPRLVVTLGCAFALAYVAGVAIPIAPAGLGARDGVLVLLLAPVLGVGAAGMVAVVSRLAHTAADFLLGALAWCLMRWSDARSRPGVGDDDH